MTDNPGDRSEVDRLRDLVQQLTRQLPPQIGPDSRFRVGRKQPRNIYLCTGADPGGGLVGQLATEQIARFLCGQANQAIERGHLP